MAKVRLAAEEWYPVYSVIGNENKESMYVDYEIELTEEELAFVLKADADFRKAQELIVKKLTDEDGLMW